MTSTTEVATALLKGDLPTREIAGLIYEEAEITSPVAMRVPPSIESVSKRAKKNWVLAATAVLSKVPEYAGNLITKHRSVNVQKTYAQHGEDPETLQALCGLVEEGGINMVHWAENVNLEWLHKWAPNQKNLHYKVFSILGRRLAEAEKWDHKLMRKLSGVSRDEYIMGALETMLAEKNGAGARALLAKVSGQKNRKDLCLQVYEENERVLDDLFLDTLLSVFPTVEELGERLAECGQCQVGEPEMVSRIISLFPDKVFDLLDEAVLDDCLEELCENPSFETINWIVNLACGDSADEDELDWKNPAGKKVSAAKISTEVLDTALQKLGKIEVVGGRPLTRWVATCWGESLSGEAILQALRHGEEDATFAWLCGEGFNKPCPEILGRLLADPGIAFRSTWEDDPYVPGKEDVDLAAFLEGMTFLVDEEMDGLLELPQADEIVEMLGVAATEALIRIAKTEADESGRSPASQYLARRITDAVGADLDKWRLALHMLAKSTQPLGRTLSGVRRLGGAAT